MQTRLADFVKDRAEGREAEAIVRSCVHCGFCTAACPTYQLLGDERDGPRGRIYLLKQLLEGAHVSAKTQLHLDRCLSCRSCETACPSGVRYGRLADIGRGLLEQSVRRPWLERLHRASLRALLPYPARLAPLLAVAQRLRPLLPARFARTLPDSAAPTWPAARHARVMLAFDGCVQTLLTPAVNAAAARVLDRLGISLVRVPAAGCCGALSYHLSAQAEGMDFMRRNIDAWLPLLDQAEAIVSTASGCGAFIKDYGAILQYDSEYAAKAARIAAATRDIAEVLAQEDLTPFKQAGNTARIAFHPPCTLQHGQRLNGSVETLLAGLGFTLLPVADTHLCCGSAGSYSLLQPGLSKRLLADKCAALHAHAPDLIATANIGCQHHIQSATDTPVRHWIELLSQTLQ